MGALSILFFFKELIRFTVTVLQYSTYCMSIIVGSLYRHKAEKYWGWMAMRMNKNFTKLWNYQSLRIEKQLGWIPQGMHHVSVVFKIFRLFKQVLSQQGVGNVIIFFSIFTALNDPMPTFRDSCFEGAWTRKQNNQCV